MGMRGLWWAMATMALILLLSLTAPQAQASAVQGPASGLELQGAKPRPVQAEPNIFVSLSPAYYNFTDKYWHVPGKLNVTVFITPREVLDRIVNVKFCIWQRDVWSLTAPKPIFYDERYIEKDIWARGGWVEVEVDWGDPMFWLNFTLVRLGWCPPQDWYRVFKEAAPYWGIVINVTYTTPGGAKVWKAKWTYLYVHYMPGEFVEEYHPWKAPARWLELGMRPRREEYVPPEAPGYWRVIGRRYYKGVVNVYWRIEPVEAEAYEQQVLLYLCRWDHDKNEWRFYELGGDEIGGPMDMTEYTRWQYNDVLSNWKYGFWYGYTTSWPTALFEDGVYNMTVAFVDTYGNIMRYTVFAVVDNTPPEVEIVSPPEGARLSGAAVIEFKVVEANPFIATFSVAGVMTKYIRAGEFDATGAVNRLDFDTTAIGDGRYTLRLEVEDMAGNTNSTMVTVEIANFAGLTLDAFNDGMKVGLLFGVAVGLIVGAWACLGAYKYFARKR